MPLNIIEITRGQDIQLGDVADREEYRSLFTGNNIGDARELINDNVQLFSKAISPELVSELSSGITTMQTKYKTDVTDIFASLIIKNDTNISNFKKVVWDISTEYVPRNFVIYENLVYVCVENSVGELPSESNKWVLIGLRGEDGALGLGVKYIGNWATTTSYQKYNMVTYQNKLYVAKSPNIGVQPDSSSTVWFMAMDGTATVGITASSAEPEGVTAGELWWNIIRPLAVYNDLSVFTYTELNAYTYEQLREGDFMGEDAYV